MTNDNELIRRGDVVNALYKHANGTTVLGGQNFRSMTLGNAEDAIRAIPAAASVATVKPLVWHDCADGTAHDDECQYEIEKDGKYWRVIRGVTGGTSYLAHAASYDAAKSVAQTHHDAATNAALTIHPADPLSDPRVVALVEAAKALLFAHDHGNGLEGWYNVREKLREALRAIGGEA